MTLCVDILNDVLQFLNISECTDIMFASKCLTTLALRRIDLLSSSLNMDVETNRLADFIFILPKKSTVTESEMASIAILIRKVSHFVSFNVPITATDISFAVLCNIMKENIKLADKIKLFFGVRKKVNSEVLLDAMDAVIDLSELPNVKAKHLWMISRILDQVFADRKNRSTKKQQYS